MSSKYILTITLSLLCVFLLSCKDQKTTLSTRVEAPKGMVYIPGGILDMGGDNDQEDANEFPKHKVEIESFYMDEKEVTNDQFREFVESTGYITIAERAIDWEEMKSQLPSNIPRPHDSIMQLGSLVFEGADHAVSLNNPEAWWKWTIGANWKHPQGPGSNIDRLGNHPVVHVSWEDAVAYSKWAGKRLPSEAEWEWAARGGKKNMIYPWGNESINEGAIKANFYQGLFPFENTIKDGYEFTAPVKSYPANVYGLYDMSGNVWEWCEDWFDGSGYKRKTKRVSKSNKPSEVDIPGLVFQHKKVIRGGSFLCNDSYCSGYRNARRMGSTSDTALNHTGFRCVKD